MPSIVFTFSKCTGKSHNKIINFVYTSPSAELQLHCRVDGGWVGAEATHVVLLRKRVSFHYAWVIKVTCHRHPREPCREVATHSHLCWRNSSLLLSPLGAWHTVSTTGSRLQLTVNVRSLLWSTRLLMGGTVACRVQVKYTQPSISWTPISRISDFSDKILSPGIRKYVHALIF